MHYVSNFFNIWSHSEINPYLTDDDIVNLINLNNSDNLSNITTLSSSPSLREDLLKNRLIMIMIIFKSCNYITINGFISLFKISCRYLMTLFSNINSLHFIDCANLNDEVIDVIINNGNGMIKSLNTFELSYNHKITSAYFIKLINEALFLKGIMNLKLTHNNNVNDEVLNAITESANMSSLHSLNLKYCRNVTNNTISKIHLLKDLKYLNISGCENINDQGITALNKLTKLEVLKLNNLNLITIQGIRVLINSPNCQNFLMLSMNYCRYLDRKVIEELMFSPYLNKLTKLSIKENKSIGYIGIYQMLNHKNFENLQCLKLDNIQFHTDYLQFKQYAKKFDHALVQSKTLNNLTELYIPKILKLRKFMKSDKGKCIKKLIYHDAIQFHKSHNHEHHHHHQQQQQQQYQRSGSGSGGGNNTNNNSNTSPNHSSNSNSNNSSRLLKHMIQCSNYALILADEISISRKARLTLLFEVEVMILPKMISEERINMVLGNQYFNNLKVLKIGGLPNVHAIIDLFANQNFYELEIMSIINTNFTNKFYSAFSTCLFPKLKKLTLAYEIKPRQTGLIRLISLNNCAKMLISLKLKNFVIDGSDKKYLTQAFFPSLKKFSLTDSIVKLDKFVFLETDFFQYINLSLSDISFESNTKRRETGTHERSGIYKLDIDDYLLSPSIENNGYLNKPRKFRPYIKLLYDEKLLWKDCDAIQNTHKIFLIIPRQNIKVDMQDLQNLVSYCNIFSGRRFNLPIVKSCIFEQSSFDECKNCLKNLETIEILPTYEENITDILNNISTLDLTLILTKVKLIWNIQPFNTHELTSTWQKFLQSFSNLHTLNININNSMYIEFLIPISHYCDNLVELTIQYAYLDKEAFGEFCVNGKVLRLKRLEFIMCQNIDDIHLQYLQKSIFSKTLELLSIESESYEFSYAGLEHFLTYSAFPNLYHFELKGFSLPIKDIKLLFDSFLVQATELKVEWDLQGCLENEMETYQILEIIGDHDVSVMSNQLVEGIMHMLIEPIEARGILDFCWDWDELTENFVRKYWKILLEICESIINTTTGSNNTMTKKLSIILQNSNHAEFMIDPIFLNKLVLDYLDDDLLIALCQNLEIITAVLFDYDFTKEKNKKITNKSKKILLENLIKYGLLGLFLAKQANFIDDELLNFILKNIPNSDDLKLKLFKNQNKITLKGWKLFYEKDKKKFDEDEDPHMYFSHFLEIFNNEAKLISKKSKIDSFIKKSTLMHYNKFNSINYNMQVHSHFNTEKAKALIIDCEESQILDQVDTEKHDQNQLLSKPKTNFIDNSESKTKVDQSEVNIPLSNTVKSLGLALNSPTRENTDNLTGGENFKSSISPTDIIKIPNEDDPAKSIKKLHELSFRLRPIDNDRLTLKKASPLAYNHHRGSVCISGGSGGGAAGSGSGYGGGGSGSGSNSPITRSKVKENIMNGQGLDNPFEMNTNKLSILRIDPVKFSIKLINTEQYDSPGNNPHDCSHNYTIGSLQPIYAKQELVEGFEFMLTHYAMIKNVLNAIRYINIGDMMELDFNINIKKLIVQDDMFKNIQKLNFHNGIFNEEYNELWYILSKCDYLQNLSELQFENVNFDLVCQVDYDNGNNLFCLYTNSRNFAKKIKKISFLNSTKVGKFFEFIDLSLYDLILEELILDQCEFDKIQTSKLTHLKIAQFIKCYNPIEHAVFQIQNINLKNTNLEEFILILSDKDIPRSDVSQMSLMQSKISQANEDYTMLRNLKKLKVHNIELELTQILGGYFTQRELVMLDKIDLSFNYISNEDFILLMKSPQISFVRHFKLSVQIMQDKYIECIGKKKFTRLTKLTLIYENINEDFEIGLKQLLKSPYLKKLDWQRFYNKHKSLTNTDKFARIALSESDFYSKINWFSISNLYSTLAVKILHKITPEIFNLEKFFIENERCISDNDQIFNVFIINDIFYPKLYSIDITIFTHRRLICKLKILQALLSMTIIIMSTANSSSLTRIDSLISKGIKSKKDSNICSLLLEYSDEIDDQIILLICKFADKLKFSKDMIIKLNSRKHELVRNVGLNNLIQRFVQNHKEKDIYNWVIIDDFWRNLIDGKSLQIISNTITTVLIYCNNHLDFSKNLYLTTNGEYEIMKDIIENIELISSPKLNQHNREYLKKLYDERFDLNNIEQDDICGESLLKIIKKSPFLKRLTLSNKNFGDKFCENLSYIIISRSRDKTQYINKIDLCNNPRITIIGKRLLYTALVGDTKIHMIDTKCDEYLIKTNLDILIHHGLYYTIQYNLMQYIQKIKKDGFCHYHDHYCIPTILYSIFCCPLALWQIFETPIQRYIQNMRIFQGIKRVFKLRKKRKGTLVSNISLEDNTNINNNNTTIIYDRDYYDDEIDDNLITENDNNQILYGKTKFVFTRQGIILNSRLKNKRLWYVLTLNYLFYGILNMFCNTYFRGGCEGREWISYLLIGIYLMLSFLLEFSIFWRIKTIINDKEIIPFNIWTIFEMIQSQIARFTEYSNLYFINFALTCANADIGLASAFFIILYTILICFQIYKVIIEYIKVKEELYTTYINLACRLCYNLNFLQVGKTLERFSTSSTISFWGYDLPQIVVTTMITSTLKNFPQAILQLVYLSAKNESNHAVIFGLVSTGISVVLTIYNLLKAKPSVCTSEMLLAFSKSDRTKLCIDKNKKLLRKNAFMEIPDKELKEKPTQYKINETMENINSHEILSPTQSLNHPKFTFSIDIDQQNPIKTFTNFPSSQHNLGYPTPENIKVFNDSLSDIDEEDEEDTKRDVFDDQFQVLETIIRQKKRMKKHDLEPIGEPNIDPVMDKPELLSSIFTNLSLQKLKVKNEYNSNVIAPKSKITLNEIPGQNLPANKPHNFPMSQIFFRNTRSGGLRKTCIGNDSMLSGRSELKQHPRENLENKDISHNMSSSIKNQNTNNIHSHGYNHHNHNHNPNHIQNKNKNNDNMIINLEGQTIFNAEYSRISFQKKDQHILELNPLSQRKLVEKRNTILNNPKIVNKNLLTKCKSSLSILHHDKPNATRFLLNDQLERKQPHQKQHTQQSESHGQTQPELYLQPHPESYYQPQPDSSDQSQPEPCGLSHPELYDPPHREDFPHPEGYSQPHPEGYSQPHPEGYLQSHPEGDPHPRPEGYPQPHPEGYSHPRPKGYPQPHSEGYSQTHPKPYHHLHPHPHSDPSHHHHQHLQPDSSTLTYIKPHQKNLIFRGIDKTTIHEGEESIYNDEKIPEDETITLRISKLILRNEGKMEKMLRDTRVKKI